MGFKSFFGKIKRDKKEKRERDPSIVFSNQKDVYPHCNLTKGRERILIELDEKEGVNPDNLNKYEIVKKYQKLVEDIANEVAESIKGKTGKDKEEAFIKEVWEIMNSNFEISDKKNLTGFLYEGLNKDELDCDNSSFLVYDIAKELGINTQMVVVPKHVLIKTDNFYFETTIRYYTNKKEYLKNEYGNYFIILKEDQIQSITYDNRGIAKNGLGKYKEAIKDFDEAIKINSEDAAVYDNRGIAKAGLGKYKEAIQDFDRAIELNPEDPNTYYNRANAKHKSRPCGEAIPDLDKAIELDPMFAKAYKNRAFIKRESGKYGEALEDTLRAFKLS